MSNKKTFFDYSCDRCSSLRKNLYPLIIEAKAIHNRVERTQIRKIRLPRWKNMRRVIKGSSFFFDAKGLFIYKNVTSKKILREFGVLKWYMKYLPKFIYMSLFYQRYFPLESASNISGDMHAIDIILLKPALETGGSQIKILDYEKQEITSLAFNLETAWLVKNEIDALTTYRAFDFVPDIRHVYCSHCYSRDFIKGKSISFKEIDWRAAVGQTLNSLQNVYMKSGVKKVTGKDYINNLAQKFLEINKDEFDLNDSIKMISVYLNDIHSEDIFVTKAHGDFALKNIIAVPEGQSVLIDWERHSTQSIFFDVSNLLFKLDHHNQITIDKWKNEDLNSILYDWIKIIGKLITSLESPIQSMNRFWMYYCLFLLERLDLEFRIHKPPENMRAQEFLKIWLEHIKRLKLIFKENNTLSN